MDDLIPAELKEKLNACRKLPSPPSFALQVIDLANDPEVEIDRVVTVLSQDPAIVGKILRTANSPLYANYRQVETLQVAILLLGLNATLSLALSFSLIKGLPQENEGTALNHPLYWKRAGLAAAASRVLGKYCAIHHVEELFIAALLQDIGMLALDQIYPDLYADPTLIQQDHTMMVTHEQEKVGANHAIVGGWLLTQWQLPERLHGAVAFSENPLAFPADDERGPFVRCVAGGGVLAHLLLNGATDLALQETEKKLGTWLDIPRPQLIPLLKDMMSIIPEVDQLFDLNISQEINPEDLLERARESQCLQTLHVAQENEQLKTGTIHLESQYDQLEESSQRDGLTGVFNRAFLDEYVAKAFQQVLRNGLPISLGFVDLDHFKQVNDTYGHAVGDQVLQAAAKLLQNQVRACDVVGRYGGEEFVVVLSGSPASGAQLVFDRILDAFRHTPHEVGEGQTLTVTTSIGMATHSADHPFPDVRTWLHAADQGVYAAKRNGRDQCRTLEDATT